MIQRYAPVLVLLAACSPEGGNASGSANTAAPASGTAAPAAVTPVTAGATATFGDWYVGCDNLKACQMRSLGDDLGNQPPVTLLVARDGGPDGAFLVTVEAEGGAARGLQVDGKTVGQRAAEYPGATGAAIAAAMVNGRAMRALDADGKPVGDISLKGASAALRWIDDQQGRVGTVTAAVAKGEKPASAVPAVPAMPTVAAFRVAGEGTKATAAQAAEMAKLGECETDSIPADTTPASFAASDGTTLFLAPCSAGAYNVNAAVFALKGGKLTPVAADAPAGYAEGGLTPAPIQLVNADAENGYITSYAKGRGVGDCGTSQTFAWDGTRLRLVEQGVMGECRGNTGLVTTWRAKVELK